VPAAAYDEIADWYEDFVHATWRDDAIGIGRSLAELLGPGRGTCLEIGCGTGFHADRVRQLGEGGAPTPTVLSVRARA